MDEIDLAVLYLIQEGIVCAQCANCKMLLAYDEVLDLHCDSCDDSVDKDSIILIHADSMPKA